MRKPGPREGLSDSLFVSGLLEDEPQQPVTVCYSVGGGPRPNHQISTGIACRRHLETLVVDN